MKTHSHHEIGGITVYTADEANIDVTHQPFVDAIVALANVPLPTRDNYPEHGKLALAEHDAKRDVIAAITHPTEKSEENRDRLYFFERDEMQPEVMTVEEARQKFGFTRYHETPINDIWHLRIWTWETRLPNPFFDDISEPGSLTEIEWQPIAQAVVKPANWNIKPQYIAVRAGVEYISAGIHAGYQLDHDVRMEMEYATA